MAVTLQDIADSANVAVSTVSRVLNNRNDPHISKKTTERVLKAASELGYQPNYAARALVTGRTYTVALWTAGVYPSFYSYTIYCLRRAVRPSKYELQVIEVDKHLDKNEISPLVSFWRPDGLIVFEDPWYVEEYSRAVGVPDRPIVGMGVYVSHDADYVGVDIYSGVVEAIEYLYNTGRRRIAYVLNSDEVLLNDQRHNAYKHVMENAGLEPEYIIYPNEGSISQRRGARNGIRKHIEEHGCPEAVFCYDDEVAIGTYRGLRDMGIKIPDDIALIGCDGIEDTEYMDVPISTIVQPIRNMCVNAWDFLQKRIDDPSIPQQKAMLKAEFVVRQSC